jgi:hypothetical protein
MFSPLPAIRHGVTVSALITFALAFAGCASGPERPGPGKRGARAESIPTLAGQAEFFDGRIVAEVKIGAVTGFKAKGEPDAGGGERPRGRHGGGGFGGGMGGPGGGGHGPRGEGSPGDEPGEGPRITGMRSGMTGPLVLIHLRFVNRGTEPVELRIADFLSPLGNFAVQPEKLTLAPGASAEVEPMTSGLASQISGGEITLKLQLGGRRDTQVVPLHVEAGSRPESGNSGQTL